MTVATPRRGVPAHFWMWSLVAVTAFTGMRWASPWNEHLLVFIGLYVAAFLACWGVSRTRVGFWPLCLGAVVFRMLLVTLPPTLSGDIYRYVWEGRVQAAGVNPYVQAPAAPELAAWRDADWPRINHPEATAIYPPFAQLVFRGLAACGGVTFFKAAFVVLDLGVIVLLAGALRQRGAPPARLALYAWNPLAVVEVAGSGHMEPLALVFLVAALVGASSRPASAWVALAACVAVKLAGLAVAPLVARVHPPRPWMLGVALLGMAAVSLPYADAGAALFASLRLYAAKWRFNDLLFAALVGFLGSLAWAKVAAALLVLAVLGLLVWRRVGLERAAQLLLGAALLLSPTIHPWYLLWPAVLLPLAPLRPLFLWSGSIVVAYLFVFPLGPLPPFPAHHWLPRGLEVTPPMLGLLWDWQRARAQRLRPSAGTTSSCTVALGPRSS
jgi:hypothetical protein